MKAKHLFFPLLLFLVAFAVYSCGNEEEEIVEPQPTDYTPSVDVPELGVNDNTYCWQEKTAKGEIIYMWYAFTFLNNSKNITPCQKTKVHVLCPTMDSADEMAKKLEEKTNLVRQFRYFYYDTDEFFGKTKIEIVYMLTGETLTPDPPTVDTTQLEGTWDAIESKTKTTTYYKEIDEYITTNSFSGKTTQSRRYVFKDGKMEHWRVERDLETGEIKWVAAPNTDNGYYNAIYTYKVDVSSDGESGKLYLYYEGKLAEWYPIISLDQKYLIMTSTFYDKNINFKVETTYKFEKVAD